MARVIPEYKGFGEWWHRAPWGRDLQSLHGTDATLLEDHEGMWIIHPDGSATLFVCG